MSEGNRPNILVIWGDDIGPCGFPSCSTCAPTPSSRPTSPRTRYYDWFLDNDYIALAATAVMTQFLATFKDFPPRQKAASFTIDQVVAKLENALTQGR